MSFELKLDKRKRAFTLLNGQYEYSNTVNDEVIKIVTLNTLPIQRRLYFCKDGFEKFISTMNENVADIIDYLNCELEAVGEIVKAEFVEGNELNLYDDLYNLFFAIINDGAKLMGLAQQQCDCEDRYNLPKLEELPRFNANVEIDYSDCKTNYHYVITTVAEYINILFHAFVSNNPVVSVCQNCTKLFVPKTKKITLYCDRVPDSNSTCKRIGAKNKHNDKIEEDPVLKKYHMEKHRIEMYCLRGKQDKYDFFDELFDWLNKYEPKLQAYKQGEYYGDKLVAEIEAETPNYQAYSKGLYYVTWTTCVSCYKV